MDGGEIKVDESWEPWHFPSIEKQIRQIVSAGVAGDSGAKVVFEQMRAFTVLQRLFRLALSGDLGLSFPLQELKNLQQETAVFVKAERNERWNINEDLLSIFFQAHKSLKDDVTSLASGTGLVQPECKAKAREVLSNSSATEWPQGRGMWASFGLVEQSCKNEPQAYSFNELVGWLRRNDLIEEAIHQSRTKHDLNSVFTCHPL